MRNFWSLLFVLSQLADSFGEEKKAEEVIGTLGESVTFQLKTSQQFKTIYWLQGRRNSIIASVEAGQPCGVNVVLTKFEGRLNVSSDCRSLQITKLHQDDSGEYKGQIKDQEESFRLEVYKNLSESDLEVKCENDTLGGGNYTWQLNCSAGRWGDGVNYSWTSTSKAGKIPSHVVQSNFQDGDANYTCTAENPVSKASRTISVKEACKGNQSGGPPSDKLLPVWIVLGIVGIAATGIGCVLWNKKKRAARSMPPDPTSCTAPDESSKTIYALIGDLPPEIQQTGTKKTGRQKRLKPQDGLHTVYASVVQPKPMTLQTDDKKIQMEGPGTSQKSNKTIYSAVTKPQEDDDPSIKTVYDTVNAPRCPEGSEFHKLL